MYVVFNFYLFFSHKHVYKFEMQLFFTTAVFLNARQDPISVLPVCVCVRRARAAQRHREAGPPPSLPALPGQRRRERLPAAMSKKGLKLLVDSLTRSAKHCESPGCGSRCRPALLPCSSSVALFASHGRHFAGAPLGTAGGTGELSVSRPWCVPVAASCFTSLTYSLCLLVFGPGS